jgi:hypothetical protein
MQILRDKPQLADQTVRRTVDMGTDANGTEVMGFIDNIMQTELRGADQQAGVFSQDLVVLIGDDLMPEYFRFIFPGQMSVNKFLHFQSVFNFFKKGYKVHFFSGTDFHPRQNGYALPTSLP